MILLFYFQLGIKMHTNCRKKKRREKKRDLEYTLAIWGAMIVEIDSLLNKKMYYLVL